MAFWLWVVIGVIAIALIVALASRIRIRVRYSRSGRLDQLVVIVQALYGLFHYQFVLPSIVISGLNIIYRERKVGGIATIREEKKNKRKLGIGTMRRYWRSYRAIQLSTRKFTKWLRTTMKKVECTRWRLDFRVGTGDAAQTAVLTGLLWAVAGCASGVAGQFIRLATKPQSRIEPNYSATEFSAVWEADFQIRAFAACWSIIRLGTRTLHYGKALRAWRSTLAPPERA
ncbi:DUF2953 domain-containing protein [Cohnella yongneupensis]|uniref:DUF2953 domain-containing protein n=1 Tax=Cohnella yongneupensis TaxID=425006 RepID=A0ABW0R5Y2_9BACL